MARGFAKASSQLLKGSASLVTAVPLTLAGWFQMASSGSPDQVFMGLFNGSVNGQSAFVLRFDNVGNNMLARTTASDGTSANGTQAIAVGLNTWFHLAGVFASATSRQVFQNGSGGSVNATSKVPAGIDTAAIGGEGDSAAALFLDGLAMECGVWDAALTSDEIAALAKGIAPTAVRPESLQHYWPLWGQNSPEIDLVGRAELTLTNAPATAAHGRIRHQAKSSNPGFHGTFAVAPGSNKGLIIAAG